MIMETQTNNAEINNISESKTRLQGIRKRKRHHKGKFKPNFDIPGVYKIVLTNNTQEAIGCIVGNNVTSEQPWITIDKALFIDDLDLFGEVSEFWSLKDEISSCPTEQVLLGYIPDESQDVDEFYMCLTEEAINKVTKIKEKLKKKQKESLQAALVRKPKPWTSLGSEAEIEESMIKYSRNLIEVEIESRYPIREILAVFRQIKAEDMREGYMEIQTEEEMQSIIKRRIPASVQVTPAVFEKEAQTLCRYIQNSFSQYHLEDLLSAEITESFEKDFQNFLAKNGDFLLDHLRVNDQINVYSRDYENLVLNETYTLRVALQPIVEYLVFIDMELCKSKMISSLAFHPTWTGCCIVSYVEIAPQLYLNSRHLTDEVFQAVHDTHPVLFWSFKDDLKPRLILETPRPVYALSVCAYRDEMIVGGCCNGQIVIWDISNKLNRVEEEEILNVNQQNYRRHLWSYMTWMKNVFNIAILRPTAVSDLKYSHTSCVNGIQWMSPLHSVSNTGKIELLEQGQSLQFMTSGEDGCVMIWDLLRKPHVVPGGFKTRQMRRLKKRPSALLVEDSPFKALHLNLKPVYKVNVCNPLNDHRFISISYLYAIFFDPVFEKIHVERSSRKSLLKLKERVKYKPILDIKKTNTRQAFIIGTMEGDMIQATWEGLNFDTGEVVNFEECKIVGQGKFHDGPVISVDYSTITKTILTVGGKIFAIWHEDFMNRPVIWRKTNSIYTDGSWFHFDQCSIKLIRIDGYLELWNVFHKSKSPLQSRLTTNGAVTLIVTHPRKLNKNILGISDYRGSFRLFCRPLMNPIILKRTQEEMIQYINKEIQRKKEFLQWQEEWNSRHVVEVEQKSLQIEETRSEVSTASKRQKKKIFSNISPGLRYMESVREQQRLNTQSRIKSIILAKKQLDTEELKKRREPLTKIEEENEVKKSKQKNKLKDSGIIFKDTVHMLFPEVTAEQPPPPPDPYGVRFPQEEKRQVFEDFQGISIEAQDYVEDNPFVSNFDWIRVLKIGKERRRKLYDTGEAHYERFAKFKEEKARSQEEVTKLEDRSLSGLSGGSQISSVAGTTVQE